MIDDPNRHQVSNLKSQPSGYSNESSPKKSSGKKNYNYQNTNEWNPTIDKSESTVIRSQINNAQNQVRDLNSQKDSLMNMKLNLQNEISTNLDSKLQN